MSRDRSGDGGYHNPTGVDCQDCPFRSRWYPPEGSEHPHKHDLATDHDVEYVDADEIRESIDYDGNVVAVHDEQTTLVTDGGTTQTTECENCGKQRYTFERCQHCGNVHWENA